MEQVADRRAYADRRGYLIEAVRSRRKRIRRMALQYEGARCSICGYDRCEGALEFHQLEATSKDFGISDKGYTRSWRKVREELDRCILLCANCHREVHAGMQLPRETVVEESGEFRGAYPERKGNPERSLPKGLGVGRNVQRLEAEDPTNNASRAPDTLSLVLQGG
jgi:5-methylcytosine-specific restriction endonuclease McrA